MTTVAPVRWNRFAQLLHWLIALLIVGHGIVGLWMTSMQPSPDKIKIYLLHKSFGITLLMLIVVRLIWRMTHRVAPESSLPLWQRVSSESVHWLLYASVLAATFTGWLFASFRGWSVSYFYLVPVPMLATKNATAIKQIDGWHQIAEWALLVLIGIHVAAAVVHIFVYRDRIMQRMLPSCR